MDRSHEGLDQLTTDLTSAPKTLAPAAGFQAETQFSSLSGDTPQPAPAQAPQAPQVQGPAQIPAAVENPAKENPAKPQAAKSLTPLDQIDAYLWNVYQRSSTKRDSSGDFTWKDEAAAARLGVVTKQYVIGGMDADFRELLYNLGRAMDAAGLNWTILSGFRDDYRQGLAAGYKAHVGNSFHGGSRATGGFGHGCAADIEASDGEAGSNNAVWKWVDQHGEKFGIFRPMKQIDPAHVQPFGGWHEVALDLRDKRTEHTFLPASVRNTDVEKPVTRLVDTRSGVTEAQFDCVRSHHSGFRVAGLSHHQHMAPMSGRMHRLMLLHSGRMHRFGRRRMIVDAGIEKHANAQASPDTDLAGADARQPSDRANPEKHAKTAALLKAELIIEKNRRHSKPHKVADSRHSEKSPGKEAALSTDRAHRDAKEPEIKGQKVSDSKHPQKRAAAEASEHQAKAKSHVHVADRPETSDRNL